MRIRNPLHKVECRMTGDHVVVEANGVVLADSRRPVVLSESGLPDRYYLPLEDVRVELLERSARTTRCPYKGTATYWSVRVGDEQLADVVWAYEDPIPEVEEIRGRLCFHAERVGVTVTPAPEGTWPSEELIGQFLGDLDFHYRLGEDTPLPADDPDALAKARDFRDVLGRFASGVTVVTSLSNGRPVGMTAQSFASVSLSPPMVLFCPAKTSRSWPLMEQAGFFCVNLLAEDQEELSVRMATKADEKFDGVRWSPAKSGAPLLEGVLGHVDCTVHAVHEAGDHYVVVGRVQALELGDRDNPLVFYQGGYGGFTSH
jgi:3-hydroxy-9,10-secoandrosta-1,3,5(10)-triene-9,17-dione monooxygenase reductase component